MTRPWQIWIVFALCAAMAFASMGWLTVQTMHIDRQLSNARSKADLEQEISLALWRMDSKLAPLIAEEVARPPSFFLRKPEVLGNVQGELQQVDRLPVLPEMPHAVFLNFDVTMDGNWNSPQLPSKKILEEIKESGATSQELAARQAQLEHLRQHVSIEDLIAQLPEQQLPSGQQTNDQEQSLYVANSAAIQKSLPIQAKEKNYFQERNRRYQDVAQQELRKQRSVQNDFVDQQAANSFGESNQQVFGKPVAVVESISRPIWIGKNLLLARRVVRDGQTAVQGSWLDWPSLKKELLAEAADTLDGADLVPVHNVDAAKLNHMLAGLPVQLVVPSQSHSALISSPIRWALRMGWGAILLVIGAVAVLLWGVVSLSERRAAFVSSVTHELRSPLTTFRMYSDMLARGMVPDAHRQEYLETLNLESQRLSHLVENVLSYARLERGRKLSNREQLAVVDLMGRLETRLAERAAQAGMILHVELPESNPSQQLKTDVSVVEQILFNLVDNAAKYAAQSEDARIHCQVQTTNEAVTFTVRDHGPGFDRSRRSKNPRPFSKSSEEAALTAPGVGLGLALCGRLARQLGGRLDIAGDEQGASVTLKLPWDS